MKRFIVAIVGVLALVLNGCCPIVKPKPGYYGPTDTMERVVQDINANNQGITSLWSNHTFDLRVYDRKGEAHYVSDSGVLLYHKPNEFLMQGQSLAGLLFEVGSSAGDDPQYWATVAQGEKTQWWGHYKNLGKPCVDIRQLPIRPDLLIEVLGVSDVETNFLQQPVPVMKFNNDNGGYYMFTWNVKQRDHWVATKEVWYDREMKLPRKVFLFDEKGRILLAATLSEHEALEGGDVQKKVATRYELFFPETKDALNFKLHNPMVSKRGVPKPGITIRRRNPGEDIRQVQIDENCGD